MTSLKSKDDVLTLFVHLGYLAYDKRHGKYLFQTKKHWKFAKEIVYIQKQSSKLYHSRRLFFYVITFSHPQKSARSSFR